MTPQQRLWWEQVLSDHEQLVQMRESGSAACHQLHYLQMVTEKLAKAYLWRSGFAPRRSHVSFISFLSALSSRSRSDLIRICPLFGFRRPVDFQNWIDVVRPLARDLERLAPALAGDGPNPEYPWPPDNPRNTPAAFRFPIWEAFSNSGHGRRLIQFIDVAARRFPEYC